MVSRDTTFLRSVPEAMSTDIWTPFIKFFVSARNTSVFMTDTERLAAIGKAADAALGKLQTLQNGVNKADAAIRAADLGTNVEASEAACNKVRYAIIDKGMSISDFLKVLQADNDLDGLNALKSELNLVLRLSNPKGNQARLHEEAMQRINEYGRVMQTPTEQAKSSELRELDINAGFIAVNFASLTKFLIVASSPAAVSGQIAPPQRLYPWNTVEDGKIVAGKSIRLSDGLEPFHPQAQRAPSTPGIEAGKSFNPLVADYLVRDNQVTMPAQKAARG